MNIIILIIIILIIIFFLFRDNKSGYHHYSNLSGYNYNITTKYAKQKLGTRPEELYMLAEIAKYQENNDEEADYLYNMAIFNLTNIEPTAPIAPTTIIDRAPTYNLTIPIPDIKTAAPIIHSDPQNVHDTNVNDEIAQKYKALGARDMTAAAAALLGEPIMSRRAREVIDHIINHPSNLSRVNDTDLNILCNVYERAKKYDYMDSLNTSLENCNIDHIICTTGRVANILDSMTLRDPEIGMPFITNDIIRKEIYDETALYLKNNEIYNKEDFSDEDKIQVKTELNKHLHNIFKPNSATEKIIIEAVNSIE